MTEEEKYYSNNKDEIVNAIINNSKGLVYDYKFEAWIDLIKHKKDDPNILKLLSFAVRITYSNQNSGITDEERTIYKKLSSSEKNNLRIILNTFFDEDVAYLTLANIEILDSEYQSSKII